MWLFGRSHLYRNNLKWKKNKNKNKQNKQTNGKRCAVDTNRYPTTTTEFSRKKERKNKHIFLIFTMARTLALDGGGGWAARTATPLDRSETTKPNGFALLILLFLMDMIRRQWRHFRFSSTSSCSISNRLEKPKQTNRKECRELTSSNGERVLLPSRAMGPAADAISLFFSFPDPWTKVPLWLKGILRTRKKFFIFLEGTHSVCDVLDHKVKPPLSRPDDGRFEVGDLLP